MPTGLRRSQSSGHLHAINVNCFRRRPIFSTPEPCDTLLNILEEIRQKYDFDVIGYVVMPTHIHLLLSEPRDAKLATAMQVIKQRFSRTRILEEEVWERRYYDFNIYTPEKLHEKLHYIHMNPVTAGLVTAPADWPWSSYHFYHLNANGPVIITPRAC